jgi:hypothetical protein
MKKLQELKNKIIEFNPEIKELKFGCDIEMESEGIVQYVGNYSPTDEDCYFDGDIEPIYNEKYTIIGRDITLEDVLIALEKKEDDFAVRANGLFMFENRIINRNFTGFNYDDDDLYWKLGKSLDNQSKETINFLHEILC